MARLSKSFIQSPSTEGAGSNDPAPSVARTLLRPRPFRRCHKTRQIRRCAGASQTDARRKVHQSNLAIKVLFARSRGDGLLLCHSAIGFSIADQLGLASRCWHCHSRFFTATNGACHHRREHRKHKDILHVSFQLKKATETHANISHVEQKPECDKTTGSFRLSKSRSTGDIPH